MEENVSSFARYKLELGRGECEKQLGSGVLTVICEAYEVWAFVFTVSLNCGWKNIFYRERTIIYFDIRS